jgi:transketolase
MNGQQVAFSTAKLRRTVLGMAYAGNACHIGCSFSLIEILAVLYRNWVRYPDNNPRSPGRDYLVLSKGHGVMAQYACMHELGWLKQSMLDAYFSDGSPLKGLADANIPGIEATSGSLGHGFSIGLGLALGAKRSASAQKTYAIVGDGELDEGPIWEGALFAAHHQLNNFMVIVDENGFQAMGATRQVMGLGSVEAKFASFGFDSRTIDGHDEEALDRTIRELWAGQHASPKAIIAKTVKGKGVPFMENNNDWHYKRLDVHTYEQALAFLPEART